MLISTEIGSAARMIGEREAVRLYAQAGFDAWDFSMFRVFDFNWSSGKAVRTDHPLAGDGYLRFARELRHIGEDNGIFCNQSHAPFPINNTDIRGFLKRAIEITAEAGGKICVIHPDNDRSPEENAEFYLELLPFARDHGVKIAAENMWNWDHERDISIPAACSTGENFCRHIDAVNDPNLVACLDIGHSEMKGSGSGAVNMIHALGPRLQALHIHDNDRWHDSHQCPYTGSIDLDGVVRALKEIGYCGEFTLEADSHFRNMDPERIPDGMKELATSARRMAKLFENL